LFIALKHNTKNNEGCDSVTHTNTKQMKKQIKEALELHAKANELLYLCEGMQNRIDNMLRYNAEIAIPNNFHEHSENVIDTCQRGLGRLWRSYQIVIDKLKSLDEI